MKKFLIPLIVLFVFYNYTFPQVSKKVFHPFTGTIVLTMEAGPTYAITDYNIYRADFIAGANLEYYLPTYSKSTMGFRLSYESGYIGGRVDTIANPWFTTASGSHTDRFRTDIQTLGFGIIYNLSIEEMVFPYVYVGFSNLWFTPKGGDGNILTNLKNHAYSNSEVGFNGEVGLHFFVVDNFTINLSFGGYISPHDNLDDFAHNSSKDLFLKGFIGVSYAFLGETDSDLDGIPDSQDLCPDTPVGVKVDKDGCPIDSDKDGVPDYLDKCPDTPPHVKVDRNGCPLDTDGDGVPDYIDICPNTPHGVKVDNLGCPIDSDNDGVPDYLDRCPDTPIGVKVDKSGCPLDSDGDGVPDYLDKCPDTPAGVMVDKNGCPLDSDGDGVPDYLDKCPDTPKGVIVDSVGCPKKMEVTLSAGTTFASGSAQLLPSAYMELDKIVVFMKQDTKSRWLIEGHTDSRGSAKLNKKLSLARATSVLNYFIMQGIDGTRFEVRGMGADYPIADNSTDDGRAQNRRVKIMMLDR